MEMDEGRGREGEVGIGQPLFNTFIRTPMS